ncbi:putative oxidoreductase [Stachybotrys elegans]|uniref:Oxidoreductase n=1 Tax=Stachybotrys elegans TaxID=80388 RepID=A0A8K0S9W3_9HYPO|nr:putative oxidoreductase [Stachybotrys elegans]
MSTDKCKVLALLIGAAKVLSPGTSGYNAQLDSYFTPQAASVLPACFVTPQTANDVSTVIKSLAFSSEDGSVAIRSGGHTWFAGANSAAGGITVDLSALSSVVLSDDRSSISVGPGASWDNIYSMLDPLGLSVSGGRVAGVGAGGLTLGGGISYFGPREGFTCSQALSFQVVLADGRIVEANERQNADLWWGLRGGSNNFGVVTRITLRTFAQSDPLWSILSLNFLSDLDNQARIYGKLMAAENYDPYSSFLTGWALVPAQGLTVALNQLVYTKSFSGQNPAFYKPVLDLPTVMDPTASIVVANMSTHAQNSVALQPPQQNRYMTATMTFIPTEDMIHEAFAAFNASIPLVQNIPGVSWVVNMEPLPPSLYNGADAAKNALGLNGRSETLAVFLVSPAWSNAADDEAIYAAARSLIADVEARAKALGVYDRYIYLNYAAPWQKVIESYGPASVGKLKALRKKVDPKQFFTRKVRGGFKIPA